MLNLNYNINPSSGPGNCRGEVRFNYSASLLVVGGGGGGATGLTDSGMGTGGGGGGAGVYTGSISIVPNVVYNITVGTGGEGGPAPQFGPGASNGGNGTTSSFVGFNDSDTNLLYISASGGFGGVSGSGVVGGVGGNSGTLTINGLLISSSRAGGAGGTATGGAGGGASMIDNGSNGQSGNDAAAPAGGQGGLGIYNTIIPNPTFTVGGGGGGGSRANTSSGTLGPAGPPDPNGDPRSGGAGGGAGNTTNTRNADGAISYGGGGGGGATTNIANVRAAGGNGSDGVVIIKYAGQPKAFVTNATTVTADGFTTHTFNTGTGTLLYTYPYPWQDVVPYTVEVCPDEHNEDVRPPIYWDFHSFTSASDSSDLDEASYGFMNIDAVGTNCINVSVDSGNLFVTDAQSSVTASLTGSNWPQTGSVTMSLNTFGISYDPVTANQFFSASFRATAAQIIADPNITGSKITNLIVSASEFVRYYVSGSITATKGNIYNGPINWKVSSSSTTQNLEGNQSQLNNNSSSFNIKKDIASMVSYSNITASINGTYPNFYSFNQTASLTSSILPNTTGSVTMSLEIPEIGFSTSSRFFNATSAGNKILSASFVAQTNASYNITASVINNKGNQSNSNINWYITGSSAYLASASLNIRKDANVTMVTQSFVTSTFGTYKNDYAFNQTASLSSSFEPVYNNDASIYFIQKLDMKIPEINFTQSLWVSSSCGAPYLQLITASFQAQTNVPNYNITASIQQYQQSVISCNITASGAGGGGSQYGGGGGGMVISTSTVIQPNLVYQINIGAPGAPNAAGGETSFIGCNRTINIYAGGGQPGTGGVSSGGNSGAGSIVRNGETTLYPAFSGGVGAFQSSPFGPRIAGGGGASNTANGGNGVISGTGAANGGDGASGDTFGGFGGFLAAGPTPPGPGSNGIAGTGNAELFGAGGGGNRGGGGAIGILFIRHAGSGSLFTTTNASSSYSSLKNETTYFFTSGSGTLFYQPTPTLS